MAHFLAGFRSSVTLMQAAFSSGFHAHAVDRLEQSPPARTEGATEDKGDLVYPDSVAVG
jgi:hypothetical protein